jgi:hypothetical protein
MALILLPSMKVNDKKKERNDDESGILSSFLSFLFQEIPSCLVLLGRQEKNSRDRPSCKETYDRKVKEENALKNARQEVRRQEKKNEEESREQKVRRSKKERGTHVNVTAVTSKVSHDKTQNNDCISCDTDTTSCLYCSTQVKAIEIRLNKDFTREERGTRYKQRV